MAAISGEEIIIMGGISDSTEQILHIEAVKVNPVTQQISKIVDREAVKFSCYHN